MTGALTLHTLRSEVGDEAFFKILKAHSARHRDGNVATADFIAIAEEISGKDLSELFDSFGDFAFDEISLRTPNQTFEGQLTLQVGDLEVQLIEVGPAHTKGDAIVYIPSRRTVFTGDILFMNSHPIVWEGPIENWLRACDRILSLKAEVVVPGHGPITTNHGVQQTRDYWRTVEQLATSDLSAEDAAAELRSTYPLSEPERAIVNIRHARKTQASDPLVQLAQMSRSG